MCRLAVVGRAFRLERQHLAQEGHERRRIFHCLLLEVGDEAISVATGLLRGFEDGILEQRRHFVRGAALSPASLWLTSARHVQLPLLQSDYRRDLRANMPQ